MDFTSRNRSKMWKKEKNRKLDQQQRETGIRTIFQHTISENENKNAIKVDKLLTK